jgi:hypothetical protein
MIEDKATEKWKKRLKDMGLIVNAGADRAKQPTDTEKRAKESTSTGKKKGSQK